MCVHVGEPAQYCKGIVADGRFVRPLVWLRPLDCRDLLRRDSGQHATFVVRLVDPLGIPVVPTRKDRELVLTPRH